MIFRICEGKDSANQKYYKKETRTAVAQVAQQATHKVTGTVTDTTGESLIGVSIQEVGTSNGAITDICLLYTSRGQLWGF